MADWGWGEVVRRARSWRLWRCIALLATVVWSWAGPVPVGAWAAGWLGHPPALQCRVARVLDGDSLRLACDGTDLEVRLHCIDAPEQGQTPWGKQSRRHLRTLAGERVEMVEVERDRFGRTVAEVYGSGAGRPLLNLEQVSAGQAAVYRHFCDDPRYLAAERIAQAAGLGIWSKPGGHQSPWEYRRRQRR